MNETAQKLTEIAATHGHSDAIVAVYKWWDCLDSRQKRRVGCGRAHFLALENGHFEAFVGLQALYNKMDMSEGLNAALENGHQRVVDTICKNLPYSKSLAWAAQFGRLEVIRIVMGQEGFDTHRWRKSLYKAMAMAADFGHFEIVKFLNETCGGELFQEDKDGSEEGEKNGTDDNGGDVDEEQEEREDGEDDSDDAEEVHDSHCPLACAIKKGRMEMVKYLYANNGYRASSLEMVSVGAASDGPLEVVKLLDDDGVYAGASCAAFEFAAGGGQVEIMKFFQAKEDFDVASLDDSLGMAASFGKADVVTYLYSIKRFKPSTASIEEALTRAAGEGHLEVVKILDTKEQLSRKVIEKAFEKAATIQTVVRDQARVVEYLFATGRISPSFIRRVFVDASRVSSVEVVEFLYAKGSISPDMVATAFVHAVGDNCSDVMTFLCTTGVLTTQSFHTMLNLAVLEGDIYIVASLYNSGYVSRELMIREAISNEAGNIRIERFVRQNLRKLCSEAPAQKPTIVPSYVYDTSSYDSHQLKCVKVELFPRDIQALPHVMKLIDSFAMSVETAALEAAAIGQVDGLKRLFPRLEDKVDVVASTVTDLAATFGHSGVILATYEWRRATGNAAWATCDYAQSKAAAAGHFNAMRDLISVCDVSTLEPLKLAVENGHHGIVGLLCEAIEIEKSLLWAAEHGQLEVIKVIYEYHQDGEIWDFYEAVLTAVSLGNLPIVQFLNEKFGEELYRQGAGDVGGCPLTRAIEEGRVEIAKYLYANNGYKASAFEMAFSAAAACGPIELVELFCGDGRCDTSLRKTGFVLAAGGGHSAIMNFFRSKEDFDVSVVSEAFVRAAGCGQTRIVQQLYAAEGHDALTTIDSAAMVASGGGHLEVAKFFDSKGHVTEELGVKMFSSAATDEGLKCAGIDDQVSVMKYLYSKGWVSTDAINEVFVKAASSSCVEVVEFLFNTRPIPSDVVDEAFGKSTCENCAPVVEFLCKSCAVSSQVIETVFVEAAEDNDIYSVETLYNSGCTSPELLNRALRAAPQDNIVQIFLSRKKAGN
ncbi:hypothetical protein PR001_g16960 [Phytophthora rubi]|uniref:Uncharacterized protein n=1 Tax=Phytophthora rubi TaxID=129364 RepID=A0A6A3KP74_9STRA|nr:hypothetical protein PR002_g18239 [Phytophthora rubi]KAE9007477.1 hypothetical protein PR001_g16960 [Phytophthora rubi]